MSLEKLQTKSENHFNGDKFDWERRVKWRHLDLEK